MKTLVVVCALVACCTASGGWGYSSIAASPLAYGYGISAYPKIDAATLVASRTIAAAPVVEAAPAVAYKNYAAAPVFAAAPVVEASPAVAYKSYAAAPVIETAPAVAYKSYAAPAVAYKSYAAPEFRAFAPAPAFRAFAPRFYNAAPVGLGAYTAAPVGLGAYAAAPLGLGAYAAAPAVAAVKTIAAAPVVEAAPVVAAAPAVVEAIPAVKTVAAAPVIASAPAVVATGVTKTQYHSQDELGQATYGHAEPLQTHNAVQDAHGNKVGSFSYLNPHDGQIHRTDYVADADGYRVASNDLPIAARAKRSVLFETPASTVPLAHHFFAPSLTAYSASPILNAYTAHGAAAVVAAPGHALRDAVLTEIVNNPGHAVSYRVD